MRSTTVDTRLLLDFRTLGITRGILARSLSDALALSICDGNTIDRRTIRDVAAHTRHCLLCCFKRVGSVRGKACHYVAELGHVRFRFRPGRGRNPDPDRQAIRIRVAGLLPVGGKGRV